MRRRAVLLCRILQISWQSSSLYVHHAASGISQPPSSVHVCVEASGTSRPPSRVLYVLASGCARLPDQGPPGISGFPIFAHPCACHHLLARAFCGLRDFPASKRVTCAFCGLRDFPASVQCTRVFYGLWDVPASEQRSARSGLRVCPASRPGASGYTRLPYVCALEE